MLLIIHLNYANVSNYCLQINKTHLKFLTAGILFILLLLFCDHIKAAFVFIGHL